MSRAWIQADGRHLIKVDKAGAQQAIADRLEFEQAVDYDSLSERVKAQFSRKTFDRLRHKKGTL